MSTLFRIGTDRFELAVEGSEAFVREQMRRFLPSPAPATPAAADRPADPSASTLADWYAKALPTGRVPTMQDAILVFGYYLKRAKDQHIFRPGDIKRSFTAVNRRVPKSLLQIMGSLKRDRQLLWSPEDRRGQYALTPLGIKHVERLLEIRKEGPVRDREAADDTAAEIDAAPALQTGDAPRSSFERWDLLFKTSGR